MRLTTGYFGVFVITAAISAAGTLGLPDISLSFFIPSNFFGEGVEPEQYERLLNIVPGVIPGPFVALFGFPAILGLSLGQFVASTTSPIGPVALYFPLVSSIGLVAIYVLRKRSVIVGSLVYTAVTALWISVAELIANETLIASTLPLSFLSQLVAIMIGFIAYTIAKSTNIFRTERGEKKMNPNLVST